MKQKLLVAAVIAVAINLLPAAAQAATITLDPVAVNDPLQQQTNNPCFFGGADCNSRTTAEINAFTPTPNYAPGVNLGWDLESPTYTLGVLRALFGDHLRIGLDFSQAQGAPDQVLGLFAMIVLGPEGLTVQTWTGPQAVGPTPGGNAGNGFADYVLSGFDLSGLSAISQVKFHAIMINANDGPDQAFFLRQLDEPPVPEPTTLTLLGLSLLGAGYMRRRRR